MINSTPSTHARALDAAITDPIESDEIDLEKITAAAENNDKS